MSLHVCMHTYIIICLALGIDFDDLLDSAADAHTHVFIYINFYVQSVRVYVYIHTFI